MPQTLDDLRNQFGGRWYDFGASEQRKGAQGAPGWWRAPRIDPRMAEAVWNPQYGWQDWRGSSMFSKLSFSDRVITVGT